jgi:hypothetical protein
VRRRPIPVSPGQLSFAAMLRAYPEALRVVTTATGRPLAILLGGAIHEPTPVVALRRVAA